MSVATILNFRLLAGLVALFAVIQGVTTTLERRDSARLIAAQQENLAKTRALEDARHAIGYGAGIHNFKNFVLRGDAVYAFDFERNMVAFDAGLTAYRALETDPHRLADIAVVEAVIAQYRAQIAVARAAFEAGSGVEVIDALVRIDDAPARAALERIARGMKERLAMLSAQQAEADAVSARNGMMQTAGLILIGLFGLATAHQQRRRIEDLLRSARHHKTVADGAHAAAKRERMRLLANASHELRQPLNAIITYAGLIGRSRPDGAQNDDPDLAANIRCAGEHAALLIDDLMALSSAEAGGVEPVIEPTDIRDTIEAAVQMIGDHAARAGVTIRLRGLDDYVVAQTDPRMLRQIVINLVTNAVKYAGAGHSCEIAVERLGDGQVRMTVTDDGPGMTPDELEQAMKPFTRLKTVATAQQRGHGLGLPLVRALVDQLRGHLLIRTAPGAGVIAEILLPAPAPAPAE